MIQDQTKLVLTIIYKIEADKNNRTMIRSVYCISHQNLWGFGFNLNGNNRSLAFQNRSAVFGIDVLVNKLSHYNADVQYALHYKTTHNMASTLLGRLEGCYRGETATLSDKT